jgi:hypothetical protein
VFFYRTLKAGVIGMKIKGLATHEELNLQCYIGKEHLMTLESRSGSCPIASPCKDTRHCA